MRTDTFTFDSGHLVKIDMVYVASTVNLEGYRPKSFGDLFAGLREAYGASGRVDGQSGRNQHHRTARGGWPDGNNRRNTCRIQSCNTSAKDRESSAITKICSCQATGTQEVADSSRLPTNGAERVLLCSVHFRSFESSVQGGAS
jgi:hypothetical protein